MPSTVPAQLSDPLSAGSSHRWIAVVLLFGVGDLVTTALGLWSAHIVEVGIAAPLIRRGGLGMAVLLKLVVFAVFYPLWRVVPQPYCDGIPIGLVLVGLSATLWNLLVLASVSLV